VEGLTLRPGWESFVGAGALPMRMGSPWGSWHAGFVASLRLDVDCQVVPMQGWQPQAPPGHGWPVRERTWVNPSPNAPNLWMARCYPGSVMVEGTTLSEGRGTTRPLELLGAPDLDVAALLAQMRALAPAWLRGCRLRPCWFEPMFHKHAGKLCAGFQVHVETPLTTTTRRSGHAAVRARVQGAAGSATRLSAVAGFPLTSTSTGASPST